MTHKVHTVNQRQLSLLLCKSGCVMLLSRNKDFILNLSTFDLMHKYKRPTPSASKNLVVVTSFSLTKPGMGETLAK